MIWLCHAILVAVLSTTQTASQINPHEETPAWKKEEMYRDMFSLGRSNFSQSVLQSREAWIVLFHQGSLERAWKTMAVKLRGIVWFGTVHTVQEATLLTEIGYERANGSKALVFPHGLDKAARWESTSDPETARVIATDSLPDHTLDVRAVCSEDFVVDSLMARPSRFPVLLLTEEEEASPLWKALAYRFQRHFQFGRLVRPSLEEVRQFGLSEVPSRLPHLLVLTTTAPSGSSPDFSAVPYQESSQGNLTYTSIFKFLYVVNRDHRHLLYGDNMASRVGEVEMEQVLKVEGKRFDIQGIKSAVVEPTRPDREVKTADSSQSKGSAFVQVSDHDEL